MASEVVFTTKAGVGVGTGVGVRVGVGNGVNVGTGVKVGVGSKSLFSASVWHSLSTTVFHCLARGSNGFTSPDFDRTSQMPYS